MLKICCDHLPKDGYDTLLKDLQASDRYSEAMTAWRLEGTLREFPKFPPKNLWFRYRCSACLKTAPGFRTDFCPSCGARMIDKMEEVQKFEGKA